MAIIWRDGDSGDGLNAADDAALSEINTTPLVDVMLVLLIIFLITVPVINTSVAVRLPRQANTVQQVQADTVVVSVDAQGGTYWFDTRLADLASLHQRLRASAARVPQPELHIRGDANADYQAVARVLQAAQAAGLARVGFVTQPAQRP